MSLYRIADVTVSMSPCHSLTENRALPYRIADGVPDITISADGNEYEEYAEFARLFYEQLIDFDGLLLHASAVECNGVAVAFSASSGTGKSTHSSFWRSELGASIINDDKPALRRIDGVMCACGTPFSGKCDLSRNVCVPLRAIVFLTRAENVCVRRLSTEESLYRILSQTIRPRDERRYVRLLGLLDELLKQTEVYEAGVPNDPFSAFQVKQAIGM